MKSMPVTYEAVDGPNAMPSGSRFDTSTKNYAAGLPESPTPEWLLEAAARFAVERAIAEELHD